MKTIRKEEELTKAGIILWTVLFITVFFIYPVQAEEPEFTVDFSANVTNGTAPLVVQFTNLVTGNQVSGFWVINNETIVQLPGPEYMFTVPGSYDIALTVTDDTNTTLTETKFDYIIVSSAITTTALSFSHTGLWGSNPVVVTDKSSGAIVFIGKTSSKNIMLNSSGTYSVEIGKGGITDILNSPDYGLYVVQDLAKNNIIGIIFGVVILIVIIGLFRSKK